MRTTIFILASFVAGVWFTRWQIANGRYSARLPY